ncbi:MAG: Dam family site-specific DNA-(adenine-N6)-methyltransferase [Anaerolineae bacterium]
MSSFCGGLAVALGLRPANALLNDMNPHLINFYYWLNRGLSITLEMRYDRDLYYQHRQHFNQLIASNQHQTSIAAELFYYLNRTGYNGLCRFNRSGAFNVPFGKHTSVTYVTDFNKYRGVFDNWGLRVGRFEELTVTADDFIYADPPYDVEFVSYSKEGFSWSDQVRLAEWLEAQPCPVILSNQATPRIIELYQRIGFMITYVNSPRRISSDGNRTPAREILAFKELTLKHIEGAQA